MVNMAMGLQARMIGKAMLKQSGSSNKMIQLLSILIQLREKIGMVFDNPEVTQGIFVGDY